MIKKTNKRKAMGKSKDQVIIPVSESLSLMPEGYKAFIADIKERILKERIKNVLSANSSIDLLHNQTNKKSMREFSF